MDIIDIIIAKKKSFTGETESLIQQAQAAMAQANQVATILQDAQEANAAAQEAQTAAEAAQAQAEAIAEDFDSLKSDFTAAAENLTNTIIDEKLQTALAPIQSNISNIPSDINTEIKKVIVTMTRHGNMPGGGVGYDLITTYPDNTTYVAENVLRMYPETGSHVDGTMTQEAISYAIALANQEINKLNTRIDNINITNNTNNIISNLGIDNAGNIVIIGPDGTITSGSTSEAAIIEALIKAGVYTAEGVVGLQIDYANKIFTRTQDAVSKTAGTDFNDYPMYGGRMRCNVADDGTINAFYGDNNYTEDGSNGQVMVYQPKFYYQRTPINMTKLTVGNSIRKESVIISSEYKSGFKLHPLFINDNGEELDYVLLPAYEGSIYDVSENNYNLNSDLSISFANDKLSSIAGAKPIHGKNNALNQLSAEQLAQNRGYGWHITNMAAESANQILLMIEYGTLNGQNAIENGITKIPTTTGANCSSITGSTTELGNSSGAAVYSINEINGTRITYNMPGYRAISYRGMENLWGNIWRFIGGVNIYGDGYNEGGRAYICKNYNYDTTSIANYEDIGFRLPSNHSWISAMGYGNQKYDWVFMPSECYQASSALPVGDNLWTVPELNNINVALIGGSWSSDENSGPFYYGCDYEANINHAAFGASLMFIPIKNSIYNANILKWQNKYRGE